MRRLRVFGHPIHPPLVHLPLGLLLAAPILLRWVARRESGSSVAARREKVLRQAAG